MAFKMKGNPFKKSPIKQESTYVKPVHKPTILTEEQQNKKEYLKIRKLIDKTSKQDSTKIEDKNKKIRDYYRKKNPITGFISNVLGK